MLEILFGMIAGTITGLGMGGGTILILLLTLFYGLEQHIAQATNLIFFVPTSLAAIWMNLKQNNVDRKLAKNIVIFGVIGAVIGSLIAEKLEDQTLKKCFAVFIFLIALHEMYGIYQIISQKKKLHKIQKK